MTTTPCVTLSKPLNPSELQVMNLQIKVPSASSLFGGLKDYMCTKERSTVPGTQKSVKTHYFLRPVQNFSLGQSIVHVRGKRVTEWEKDLNSSLDFTI